MGGTLGRTAQELSRQAEALYERAPVLVRFLQAHRPYIAPFERLIELVPTGSRVLDVGCGGGLFLHLLAAHVGLGESVGFDSSASAIAAAAGVRHRGELLGLAPRFERVDVKDAWPGEPVYPRLFDVVSIIDVMHHVPPAGGGAGGRGDDGGAQRALLRMAASRTRIGGIVLYKDMAQRPTWCALMNRLHDLLMARQWIHYAPIEQVDAWARDCGLRCERSESTRRLWYQHELRVYRRVE